ncbi:MAG: ERF family protein [Chloroflexota bacterium]|nr:ERF family protein [Chloroflexota bacterium]
MPASGLAAKLAKLLGEIQRVPKNGYNSFHKYQYATESDLTDHVRPLLAKAGVIIMPSVLSYEREGEIGRLTMKFTFIDAESGETFETVGIGEGQDKGDKCAYKCMTGAVKYMLMKTFLIATGDDPEQDEQPARGSRRQGGQRQQQDGRQRREAQQQAPSETPPQGASDPDLETKIAISSLKSQQKRHDLTDEDLRFLLVVRYHHPEEGDIDPAIAAKAAEELGRTKPESVRKYIDSKRGEAA